MASPFRFFRKHQASMMVVLVILAMLAFTLGDLFSVQKANFWLLGLLLGGALFGTAGIGSGRWLQSGIGGAIFGALLGLVVPWFNQPDGVLATTFGIIEQKELRDLSERRAVANGFMALASEEAFGPGGRQFARQFGFGHSNQQEDLLFGRLMNEEAKTLGISVSDEMVRGFINKYTADRLSRESFAKTRQALTYQQSPVLSEALFDILREQIRNELTYLALVPTGSVSPPSPEVHWKYFQRMNVRQAINVAELDVDAFVDQVKDPSDEEINELFASAANRQPNQVEPGSPGFVLPGRARIAWLEQDYNSMESDVPLVTDEEVDTFYNENRDVRYRTIVIPEQPEADAEETSIGPTPVDRTATTEADSIQDNESGDESAEDPSAAEGNSDKPAVDETTPETTSEATETEPVPEQTPAEGTEAGGQFSVDDPEAAPDAEVTDDPATGDRPTIDEDSATADIETDSSNDTDFSVPLKIPTELELESGDADPVMEPVYEYRKLDNELREIIREELLQQRVRDAIEKKMESGWEFLRSIQSELSKRRAGIMKQDAQKFLDNPNDAAIDLRRAMAEFTPELLERMKKYADENGLIYAVTPLISFADFRDEDNYPLGVAAEPGRPSFQTQEATDAVAYKMFSRFSRDVAANNTQLFMPERGVYEPMADKGTESHYVYWTVEFVEPHVPTLDEPDVRDQVIQAFKRTEAREKLTERAEELAQKVRDGLGKADEERTTMAATLDTESITGLEGSATLTVRSSQPFSWLRQSQTPQTSFQSRRPQAELSRIRFADGVSTLTGVGQEFMKTIFEVLDEEEVGIVPNYDRTRYFLVHVTNRFPTQDKGIDGLHDRFATEGQLNFMSTPITGLMSSDIVNPVIFEWERAIWKKYAINPDTDLSQSQESGSR